MSILQIEVEVPKAKNILITANSLTVDLIDGRTISVPIAWFPRLMYATIEERKNYRLIGNGEGIHWEDIDEDISIENLLMGKRSGESATSFKKWLESRSVKSLN